MTDEAAELDLLIEHRERTAAFAAAKETGGTAWREQKDSMRAWRRQWREVRAASDSGAGTATPDTVGLKTRGN